MFTLYARKEPTTDTTSGTMSKGKQDVVLYKDKETTDEIARYPWYFSTKPDKRNKKTTHNCAEYKLVWLDDLK